MSTVFAHAKSGETPPNTYTPVDVQFLDDTGKPVDVGGVKQGAAVADAAGDTPTKAEFGALLKSLRDAGVIAAS